MDINTRKCKVCKEDKNRIEAGKFPNGRDKKWVDDAGLIWNGNICGKCNQTRAKVVMKKIRSKDSNNV